jgi:microcystin-dependent protein
MDELIGTIKLFAGYFEPRGYMVCDGRLLSISQYPALYSILGTHYGGNGQTNFALPDLRSRVPVGAGQGNNLSTVSLGQTGGCEMNQMAGKHIGLNTETGSFDITATGRDGAPSLVKSVVVNEQWTPIENRQPYLGLNYIICVEGEYPMRDN